MDQQNPSKPRGCLPDGVNQDAFIIIKSCRHLRLTYELRLATFMALQSNRKLRLLVSESTIPSSQLRDYATQHGTRIETHKK